MTFRFMVSGATRTVETLARDDWFAPYLGVMVTPNTGGDLARIARLGLQWVVDNSAYSGFSAGRFLRLVERAAAAPTRPLFVTVPDVVADHEATLRAFDRWLPLLEEFRLPLAFVLQDGVRGVEDVPWGVVDALFIGGSTDFKDDHTVLNEIVPEAKRRGHWVHMGRVNTARRIRLAVQAGCDSADGSSLSRFSETYLRDFIYYARLYELEAQVMDDRAEELEQEIAALEGQP